MDGGEGNNSTIGSYMYMYMGGGNGTTIDNDNDDMNIEPYLGAAAFADLFPVDDTTDGSSSPSYYYSAQEVALALVPKFFAFLSICGSSYIIADVIRTRQAFHSTHHRLLLGMSACNLAVSLLGFFLGTWTIPSTEDVFMASGNQGTCDVQGFFSQFSLAVVMYNAALSAYYCAKIRFQCRTNYIHSMLEPFFHVIPLAIGFGTAIAALLMKLYNNTGWGCWIASWPEDCIESWAADPDMKEDPFAYEYECIRGDNASIFRWVFYYGPLWLAIIFVLGNMFSVYRAVYEQEMKMNKYNFEYKHALDEIKRQKLENMLAQLEDELEDGEGEEQIDSSKFDDEVGDGGGGDEDDNVSVASSGSRFSKASSLASVGVRGALKGISSITRQSFRIVQTVQSVPYKLMKKRDELKRKHDALKSHFVQSRRVARQGYWFCGVFLATWLFPTIHSLVQLAGQKDVYGLQLLAAIFISMQGLLNCVVYVQHRIRRKHIEWACCCVFVKAGKKGFLSASAFFQTNSNFMSSSIELGAAGAASQAANGDQFTDEDADDEDDVSSHDGSETLRPSSFAALSSCDSSSSSSSSNEGENEADDFPKISRQTSLLILEFDDEDEEDMDATNQYSNNRRSSANSRRPSHNRRPTLDESLQRFQTTRRVRPSLQQIRTSLQLKSRLRASLQYRSSSQLQNQSSKKGPQEEAPETSIGNTPTAEGKEIDQLDISAMSADSAMESLGSDLHNEISTLENEINKNQFSILNQSQELFANRHDRASMRQIRKSLRLRKTPSTQLQTLSTRTNMTLISELTESSGTHMRHEAPKLHPPQISPLEMSVGQVPREEGAEPHGDAPDPLDVSAMSADSAMESLGSDMHNEIGTLENEINKNQFSISNPSQEQFANRQDRPSMRQIRKSLRLRKTPSTQLQTLSTRTNMTLISELTESSGSHLRHEAPKLHPPQISPLEMSVGQVPREEGDESVGIAPGPLDISAMSADSAMESHDSSLRRNDDNRRHSLDNSSERLLAAESGDGPKISEEALEDPDKGDEEEGFPAAEEHLEASPANG